MNELVSLENLTLPAPVFIIFHKSAICHCYRHCEIRAYLCFYQIVSVLTQQVQNLQAFDFLAEINFRPWLQQ